MEKGGEVISSFMVIHMSFSFSVACLSQLSEQAPTYYPVVASLPDLSLRAPGTGRVAREVPSIILWSTDLFNISLERVMFGKLPILAAGYKYCLYGARATASALSRRRSALYTFWEGVGLTPTLRFAEANRA